jgi:putative membrane protein
VAHPIARRCVTTDDGRDDLTGDPESSHRTQLAAERTWLAWWRTALAASAAGIGVGRLLPEVVGGTTWPYVILGCGYTSVALVLVLAGGIRARRVRAALGEGSFQALDGRLVAGITVAGALLTMATFAAVIVGG